MTERRPYTLLLADDSITIQRVVELTFSAETVGVFAVASGEEAIARIPQIRPDIVLADIGMQAPGGYEVAAFVKSRADLAHVPVLLLAGAFEPIDEQRAQAARADGVFVKPFEPAALVARVRALLERAAPSSGGAPVLSTESDSVGAPPTPVADAPAVDGARDAGAIDEYFERLGDALTTLGARPRAEAGGSSEPAAFEPAAPLPTLEDLISEPPPGFEAEVSSEPPANATAGTPIAEAAHAGGLADVFETFLSLEAADPGGPPADGHGRDVVDALVDRVAARVVEHLVSEAGRGRLAPVLRDIAARMVREELARMRATANGPAR